MATYTDVDCSGILAQPPSAMHFAPDTRPDLKPVVSSTVASSAPKTTSGQGKGSGARETGSGALEIGSGTRETGSSDQETTVNSKKPVGDTSAWDSTSQTVTSSITTIADGTTKVTVATSVVVVPVPPPDYEEGVYGTEDFGTGTKEPPQVDEINTDFVEIYTLREHLFIGNMLPTLLGAIFGIPWKVLYIHIATLDPFACMARPQGATGYASVVSRREGFGFLLDQALGLLSGRYVVLVAAALQYAAALLTPLASEAISLTVIGKNCIATNGALSKHCEVVVAVSPLVARIMMGVLAAMAVLAVMLLCGLRSWSTGVAADPRSIASIASLLWNDDVRHAVALLPADGSPDSVRRMRDELGPARFRLEATPTAVVRIRMLRPENSRHVWFLGRLEDRLRNRLHSRSKGKGTKPKSLMSTLVKLGAFSLLLIGFDALILVYYLNDNQNAPFEKFMQSQGFGVNFLFTAVGVIIGFAWTAIFQRESVPLVAFR